MENVNEWKKLRVTVEFLDEDGVATIPLAVRYRVDDVTTEGSIRAWTTVTPASSVVISLVKADNTVINTTLPRETHQMTVQAAMDTSDFTTATDLISARFDYEVENLTFVS